MAKWLMAEAQARVAFMYCAMREADSALRNTYTSSIRPANSRPANPWSAPTWNGMLLVGSAAFWLLVFASCTPLK